MLACAPPEHGSTDGAPDAAVQQENDAEDATPRTPQSDPRLSTRKPLVPGPRPIATGGRAVDQLTWAGGRLVGADSQGDSSVLLVWDDPEQVPRELTRIPGRVQGLAAAPDGRRVAIEAAYPSDPAVWSLDDPASLVVLDLDSGRVRTLVGATRGAGLRGARWSPDSTQLAILGLEETQDESRRAVVRILDANAGTTVAKTDPALRLEPQRWSRDGLLLRRLDPMGGAGGPPYRWRPGKGEPQPTDPVRWPSPDGRFWVEATPAGLLVRQGKGRSRAFEPGSPQDAEALEAWARSAQPAWCGTHHLAIQVADEVLALDLSTMSWRPLAPVGAGLPRADRSGHRLILQAGADPWWGWAP